MTAEHPRQTTPDPFEKQNARAEELLSAGDFPQAAEVLVDIIQKDPFNSRAFNTLGVLSWTREKWQDAYALFTKAVSLRPDFLDALVNLFDAALKVKKVGEASPLFDKALAADPSLDEVRVIRDSIAGLGDEIYSTRRALALGSYSPLVEEADKEIENGNLFSAMKLYLRANDEEGPSAAAYAGLGVVSYYQKKYEDAFALFVESIKLNPANPETFLNLLDAAKACGMEKEAGEIFSACVKEYPEIASVKQEFGIK